MTVGKSSRTLRRTNLGTLLRRWRLVEDIGVRELASRIGVSCATISRMERGHAMDADTLVKVLVWLMRKA